jgi:hypothetical protein
MRRLRFAIVCLVLIVFIIAAVWSAATSINEQRREAEFREWSKRYPRM